MVNYGTSFTDWIWFLCGFENLFNMVIKYFDSMWNYSNYWYMWLEIIDAEFHLRKQNTQCAYKGGITLEEIILEAPRTTMLELLGGNWRSLEILSVTTSKHIEGRYISLDFLPSINMVASPLTMLLTQEVFGKLVNTMGLRISEWSFWTSGRCWNYVSCNYIQITKNY